MRVARHEHAQMLLRLDNDAALHLPQRLPQVLQCAHEIEADIRGHLIVAAAPGVQLARHRPHEFPQATLDRRMDVFVRGNKLELATLELAGHLSQAHDERTTLFLSQHAGAADSLGVGDTSLDVHLGQTLVKVDGGIKCPHQFIGDAGVPASPQFAHRP